MSVGASIQSKLQYVESILSELRTEITIIEQTIPVEKAYEINADKLGPMGEDITPAGWQTIFDERVFDVNASVTPYDWRSHDFALGFNQKHTGEVCIGQRPYVTSSGEMAYLVDVLKDGNLEWLTSELRIPVDLLHWSGEGVFVCRMSAIKSPFVLSLNTYKRLNDGQEFREHLGQFAISTSPEVFSAEIKFGDTQGVEEFKIFIDFNLLHFYGLSLYSAKLFKLTES
jgi:hypothetical protein